MKKGTGPRKRKPRSSKFKKIAARSGEKCPKGFIPTPQAGIFMPGDLEELGMSWLRLDREQLKRDREERKLLVVARNGERETLGNTLRYWQAAGTSTIRGGRNG
jgi:hypothetical protein